MRSSMPRWQCLLLSSAMLCVAASASPATMEELSKRATDAARDGSLAALATSVEAPLREELADVAHASGEKVVRLATIREFGRYFARINELTPGARETLEWLAHQPHLLPVLMMSLGPADAPDRVLEVLRAL